MAAHVLSAGKTMLRATTPRDALQMIAVYSADAMVASSQQLRELVRQQTDAPISCPSLRVVMTAGGLISRSLLLEARAKLCTSVVNQYGSSEAGSTAYALADQLAEIEGATGYVVPGAQVEIVDENYNKLPPETDGVSCAFARIGKHSHFRPKPLAFNQALTTGGSIRATAGASHRMAFLS